MLQLAANLRLLDEALEQRRVGQVALVEHLDGDVAAEVAIDADTITGRARGDRLPRGADDRTPPIAAHDWAEAQAPR